LNGEYENAIDFMSDHHRKHPWIGDYQHVILDALFALDKDEGDFNWVEKPVVLRLSENILDACYEFLKPKRKPRSVADLYIEFVMKGYLLSRKYTRWASLLCSKCQGSMKIIDFIEDNGIILVLGKSKFLSLTSHSIGIWYGAGSGSNHAPRANSGSHGRAAGTLLLL
jgi:hypothetical protein